MHDRNAFLAAIRANPDDDAPRLNYADWLDQHGEEIRAEYIRVQCELARLKPGQPRYSDVWRRSEQLYQEHFDALAGDLPEWCQQCHFERGFLHSAIVEAEKFCQHAADLFAIAAPQKLCITGITGQGAAVAEVPELALVCELEFTDFPWLEPETAMLLRDEETGMSHDDLVALVASPNLKNLRGFRIAPYHEIGEEGCIHILEAKHLATLESLELPGQHIGDNGAEALRKAKHLNKLHTLDLSMGQMSPDGAVQIADARHLKSVRNLSLAFNDFGAEGAEWLMQSTVFKNLEELSLAANEIGDIGARAIAACPHMKKLRVLNLGANAFYFGDAPKIGAEGVEALASSENLENLEVLFLRYNEVRPRGAKTLANTTTLKALQKLDLLSSEIGDRGVRTLAEGPLLEQLVSLVLSYNDLTAGSIQALACSKKTGQLRELDLDGNRLPCEAAEVLATAKYMTQLETLSLHNNEIKAKGANALAASTLPALRDVALGSNPLLKRTMKALEKRRPGVFRF